MLRTPPHILVTTPESLYLLLTAERSREMLRTARMVIVDEIHAVIGTRRGAHLAAVAGAAGRQVDWRGRSARVLQRSASPPLRIPSKKSRRYLTGTAQSDCAIVDEGHRREMDLGLEIPRSPLEAVMSHEVWEEYYDRLTELVAAHRTTLVFVNTRRLAERLARHLSERLGDTAVTAHHGSLSKERRLDAETRLKGGHLKALVATASLELGIDIGSVDLVCQIGSPHRIATLPAARRTIRAHDPRSAEGAAVPGLARRSRRVRGAHPVGPARRARPHRLARRAARRARAADRRRIGLPASTAEDELFALVRRAWPYRALERRDFDAVVKMTADGFATRRGRRSALVHRDEVNATAARPPRRAAAGDHVGRRDPGSRRLPRRPRAGGHVHRHAERGLRDREHRRATSSSSATRRGRFSRSAPASCGSRTRKARRRRSRSGSARLRRAATSCRAR